MKVEFDETPFGLHIDVRPESVAEAAILLRYVRNASADKPDVYFNFSSTVNASIWLKKKKPINQTNSIKPGLK